MFYVTKKKIQISLALFKTVLFLVFLAVLFVIFYFFSEYIYGFLVEPYAEAVKKD